MTDRCKNVEFKRVSKSQPIEHFLHHLREPNGYISSVKKSDLVFQDILDVKMDERKETKK